MAWEPGLEIEILREFEEGQRLGTEDAEAAMEWHRSRRVEKERSYSRRHYRKNHEEILSRLREKRRRIKEEEPEKWARIREQKKLSARRRRARERGA